MWYARRLHRFFFLNSFSGNVYEYVKSVLSGRKIIAKIGDSYSSAKNVDMGIRQESIVAPTVFNSIIHDLPKSMSHDTNIVHRLYSYLDECLT